MKESFSELYSRLYRENIQELELLRGKEKRKSVVVIFIVAAVFILAISFPLILPIMFIVAFASIFVYIIKSRKRAMTQNQSVTKAKTYRGLFKEKIVGPIIENTFEGAKYDAQKGLSRFEYMKAGYKDDIDRYSSDDLIIAPLKVENEVSTSITFAEVHTERVHRDKDGHTSYSTVFHGLAGSFLIPKDLNKEIYIRSNGRVSGWNKNKVKMDMPEFEKIFDVESDDQILTMRILTADVMAEMIDLYQKYKYRFEIHIMNNTVYMRIRTGPMFEPSVFKSSMEYKQLEKYYLVLKALTNIASHMYDTILKLEL